MNRSNKRKFAVTLLGALAFGANAQAQDLNKNKITKTDSFSMIKDSKLGSKNERIEKGVSVLKKGLWKKILAGFVITGGAVEAANEAAAGIMWATGKKSDSIFKGKYSFTNLIRSKIKKNDEQPDPGDKDPKEKPDQEKLKDEAKDIESEKQKKLDAILAKFEALDKNSFAQKKGMLIALCSGILGGKYQNGPKYNKEIADKIINFINDPDGEHEVEIDKLGGIFYVFKLNDESYPILESNDDIYIVNDGGKLLSHIGK